MLFVAGYPVILDLITEMKLASVLTEYKQKRQRLWDQNNELQDAKTLLDSSPRNIFHRSAILTYWWYKNTHLDSQLLTVSLFEREVPTDTSCLIIATHLLTHFLHPHALCRSGNTNQRHLNSHFSNSTTSLFPLFATSSRSLFIICCVPSLLQNHLRNTTFTAPTQLSIYSSICTLLPINVRDVLVSKTEYEALFKVWNGKFADLIWTNTQMQQPMWLRRLKQTQGFL